MDSGSFVLKGNICYSKTATCLETVRQGFFVCADGVSQGVFTEMPRRFAALPLHDYGDSLIIPGLVDLHVHAPQYAFRGLGMDLELLEWLDTYTFSEEAKYENLDYAARAYQSFAEDLKRGSTTRACIFGTIHVPATRILMEEIEKSGLVAYVGKVNMDRNSPSNLCEAGAGESAKDTVRWIEEAEYPHVKPILTPRFIPTCSDELMEQLGEIQRKTGLPVQSHLSENKGEVAWVKELCPDAENYGRAYDRYGMFGGGYPAVMAHCVLSSDSEMALMKERGVFVAHCPQSNMNLSSGIAPIRRYLENGLHVGLGSDVAGGFTTSIFRAMSDAIQASKLRWRLVDDSRKPLSMEEAFFLGTKGGGAFFGKVGSFEPGYEADVLIIDDSSISHPRSFSLRDRLERLIYLFDPRYICGKYVAGKKIG